MRSWTMSSTRQRPIDLDKAWNFFRSIAGKAPLDMALLFLNQPAHFHAIAPIGELACGSARYWRPGCPPR
jgi:hypothetical protein